MSVDVDELQQARDRLAEEDDEATASAAERAEAGPDPDDPDAPELFPLGTIEGDPRITFAKLFKANRQTEVTASLMAAEVPVAQGKLMDPDKVSQVLVTVIPHQAVLIYKRDYVDGPVVGYKIRQPLRTTFVQDAGTMYTREQVLDILAKVGVPETADRIPELLGEE